MAVNGALNRRCSHTSSELLAWLNESLQTNFTEVEQVCTGAAYCQLMDWLYPGSIDLFDVQFQGNCRVTSTHNLNLLQAAFRKAGLNQDIPIEALMKKDSTVALTILQCFKELLDEKKGRKYHALKARKGQSLGPDKHSSSHQRPEKDSTDVILLISDDEDVDVVGVTTEQKTDTLKDVHVSQLQRSEEAAAAAVKTIEGINSYSDDKWLQLIRKYFCVSVDTTHIKHAIQACAHTPYCLYLYLRVELDGEWSTSIVLIGYLDQNVGVGVVVPLFTLQMSVDSDAETFADMDDIRAASDARLLIDGLKKVNLNLSNLAAFHCNAPHPGASREFVSQLQAYNPRLISLCGLPGMAARACQAGLLASFAYVVDLIKDIHHHYSTCSSINDSLKELFAEAGSFNPACPIVAQCLFIIHTVQKMVSCWRDLVEYFKSLRESEDAGRIRTQLMDHKVRLHFLFLSHTLEPIRALQELQEHGIADLVVELHLASMLVHSYSNSILRPPATTRFARSREVRLLYNENELLPVTEINVGSVATDFLWATPVVDLGERDRTKFLLDAQTFYKEALQSLVESIPEQLGEVALRNIGKLLKQPESVSGTNGQHGFTELSELGAQLGLCDAKSPEAHRLVVNYLSCIHSVKKEQKRRKEEGHWWAQLLHRMRAHTTLHRLLLILLALPNSLQRAQVFSKVVKSISALQTSRETSKALHDPAKRAKTTPVSKRKQVVQTRYDGRKKDEEGGKSSSEESDSAATKLPELKPSVDSGEEAEYTDNSSDIVDVTEDSPTSWTKKLIKKKCQRPSPAESVYIVSSDEEDYHMDTTNTPPSSASSLNKSSIKGELVWGHLFGFSLWPGVITPSTGEAKRPGMRTVQWYAQKMSSQVRLQSLKPFAFFSQHFCGNSFATHATYREAIFLSLQEAAGRSKKEFSTSPKDQDDLLKQMLDWAFGGFQPSGAEGLKPTTSINGAMKETRRLQVKKKLLMKDSPSPTSNKRTMSAKVRDVADSMKMLSCDSTDASLQSKWEKDWGRGGQEKMKTGWGQKGKGGRVPKKKSSLLYGFDDDMSPDFVPAKKRTYARMYNKVKEASSVYVQPDQKLREETIRRIMDMNLDIEGYCLCCGTEDVEIFHPLFKGRLCLKCKNNFTETLFRYDEDGYQSYCTICCYGMEVILCGNDSCCRSYCEDCLNILVGPGTFDSLKMLDPWVCYLCQTHQPHGALIPREDWSIRVQELFANNSAMEFEPHRVYPSIPANQRRPLRVLSLFDGIATGYLVLRELGFKVEKYVASEVCEDSLAVATVNHDGKIIHVGDVRFLTEEHLENWGPFDLLIGGSPCNDLSIVNPLRKGLYEGTGRLFFEYYRILQLLKPKEDDPRPFFWLFENVVFMNTHDKVNICRFLECNPVLVDAVKVSPAHRARYFWGNIPGMSRPIIASQSDKLYLQDCLEIGREARMTKVRTITTNPNSLKQGKVSQLPVLQDGREDILWITELEKIFGFPKHYTDVRNMNRQQRQKVLGKAWSVPVIRHLFAPLKDYFACEELSPVSTSAPKPSASPLCPGSPEAQQG